MDPTVDRVLAEARANGMEIGAQIGAHGYFEAWAVGDAAVMRIPRTLAITRPVVDNSPRFERGEGPLVVGGNRLVSIDKPGPFLDAVLARERKTTSRVLARFVDRIELAGVGVALHEHPPGRTFTNDTSELVPYLPAIARALVELHAVFGFHGDLSFDHIAVDGIDRVTFTDPLPHPSGLVVGTAGYSLPYPPRDLIDARDEGLLVRDLGALAAIAAEACGHPLGFEQHVSRCAHAIFRGAFGDGFWMTDERNDARTRYSSIADPALRGWIEDAVELVLTSYTIGHPSAGTATRYLQALANTPPSDAFVKLRDAMLPLVQRIHESPSLMAFIVAERRRTGARDPVVQAFNACDQALARLPPLLDELYKIFVALFGERPLVEPRKVAHPEEVYAESHDMRTLLVDLEHLFDRTWYTPVTLAEVGGRVARASALIAKLATNNQIQIAARRYINYVEQIK